MEMTVEEGWKRAKCGESGIFVEGLGTDMVWDEEGRRGVMLSLFAFVKEHDHLKFLVQFCHYVHKRGHSREGSEAIVGTFLPYELLTQGKEAWIGKGAAVDHRRLYSLLHEALPPFASRDAGEPIEGSRGWRALMTGDIG